MRANNYLQGKTCNEDQNFVTVGYKNIRKRKQEVGERNVAGRGYMGKR